MNNKVNLIIFHPYSGYGGADRSIARLINNLNLKKYNIYFISLNNPKIRKFLNKRINFIKIDSSKTIFSIMKIRNIIKKKFLQSKYKNIFLSNQNFANVVSFFITFKLKNINHISIERNSIEELNYANNIFLIFKKKILKLLVKLLYRYNKKVICISKDLEKEIKNFTSAKTTTIYNPALDKSIYNNIIKKKLFIKKTKKKIFVNIARLEKQKDHMTLLKAINKIKYKYNFILYILGYGSEYINIKKFILENNLSKKVKIIKNMKYPFTFLSNADLFILTSIYEGFGNVLIEAGIKRVPIISSNCKHGPKEILKNGKFGELFEIGNDKMLAKKIENYFKYINRYKSNSKSFYNSLDRFNTKKIISKYEKVFDRL